MARKTNWTDAELKLLADRTKNADELAVAIGVTRDVIDGKRRRLKLTGTKKASPPAKVETTPTEDKVVQDNKYWKNQYTKLNSKYEEVLKQTIVVDRLIEGIQTAAPASYQTAAPPKARKVVTSQTAESAVLLFSDTHIGKETYKAQTLQFEEYSMQTFLDRLQTLEDGVISILRDHSTAPLNELVIATLGDMLDGALAHGAEADQAHTIFSQFYIGAHAIAQFFRNVAAHVPSVRILTTCGNHTRFSNQKKMPTSQRYSNFDQFLYAYVEALTSDVKNIKWQLDEQPFAVFQVEGFTFFAAHGDHWRGGDKALGIPLHSIGRQINATTQLFHKHGQNVPHYYLAGHFHRPITLPHGLGDITINGAFPGLDNYALQGNFNPVDPMQTLFRVHPKYGKTAVYPIQLKFATAGSSGYLIPKKFTK